MTAKPVICCRSLHVLHINDLYHVDDFQGKSERAVRALLAMQPHVEELNPLITFGGDLLAPSLMSSVTKGQHMMEALDLLGVHVATLGNHDFDFGIDRARELSQESSLFTYEGPGKRSQTKWVCSNILGLDNLPVAGSQRWLIQDHDGVRVGIIAVSENWLSDAGLSPDHPSADKHARWEEETQAARYWAAHVRDQGADIVLCLCHDTLKCTMELVNQVPEVDFFLGGHEHIYEEAPRFVIAGYDFDDFCLLTFDIPAVASGLRPSCTRRRRVHVPAKTPPEADLRGTELTGAAARMRQLVQHYSKQVEEILTIPLGIRLGVELDTRKFKLRTQEMPAGNLFADAILAGLRPRGAVCCLIIAGIISVGPGRTPAGPLTLEHVVQWFPWEGGTCIIEVQGAVLLQALEHGCHLLPRRFGMFPHVSGIQFSLTVDPSALPGEAGSPFNRCSEVSVAGEPLDLERSYRIATTEYVADGGDEYAMLRSAPRFLDAEAAPLLHDAVTKHLIGSGPEVFPPPVAGRIKHLRSWSMDVPPSEIGASPSDPVSIQETRVHALGS